MRNAEELLENIEEQDAFLKAKTSGHGGQLPEKTKKTIRKDDDDKDDDDDDTMMTMRRRRRKKTDDDDDDGDGV